MAVKDVAQGLVSLCKQGKFDEAMNTYYSDNIVSIEPMGDSPESRGIAAVRAKGEWWVNNFEMHGVEIDGPYVNGNQFAAHFTIDATMKSTGKRDTMKEIAVYTVENDKIVHERFFDSV